MSDKVMDVKKVMELLPHRYPFLMVDRVLDYEEGKWIKAVKNVSMNEHFFQGHFPKEPIMPGVLQIEALAQTSGLLTLLNDEYKGKLAFFMTIDKCKFRKPVVPGDQLLLEVEILSDRRGIIHAKGKASVDGQIASEAEMKCALIDNEK